MREGSSLPRIAVVGVSSLIGEAIVAELRARKVGFAELHTLDDERNLGRPVTDEDGEARAKTPLVTDVAAFDFSRATSCSFVAARRSRSAMRRPPRHTRGSSTARRPFGGAVKSRCSWLTSTQRCSSPWRRRGTD